MAVIRSFFASKNTFVVPTLCPHHIPLISSTPFSHQPFRASICTVDLVYAARILREHKIRSRALRRDARSGRPSRLSACIALRIYKTTRALRLLPSASATCCSTSSSSPSPSSPSYSSSSSFFSFLLPMPPGSPAARALFVGMHVAATPLSSVPAGLSASTRLHTPRCPVLPSASATPLRLTHIPVLTSSVSSSRACMSAPLRPRSPFPGALAVPWTWRLLWPLLCTQRLLWSWLCC